MSLTTFADACGDQSAAEYRLLCRLAPEVTGVQAVVALQLAVVERKRRQRSA
jgi:hypothetical protein